jgi:kumamolisin
MRSSKPGFLMLSLVALVMLPGSAIAQTAGVATSEQHGVPYPSATTPKAIDRGALRTQLVTKPISVTLALSLRKMNEAESLLKSLHTPGDPQFHQFLSPEQFVARFGPDEAEVTRVVAGLAKYGLAAQRSTASTLRVSGSPADMERAFSVSLHSFEVPAHGRNPGYTFHAPLSHPTIPTEMSESVAAVVGLDSRPSLRPRHDFAPERLSRQTATKPSATAGNAPGFWTVTDFADHYDVTPLYNHGVTGSGRTIAIVTLASFTPSDAFAYWSAVGVPVSASRIKIVDIDGGPGAPSDASGSIETTLDVEQSGGIAPGAKIIVYQAPNTNQGFADAFAEAVDSNKAQTISTSWGFWEWYQNLENSPVSDPITGKTVGLLKAFHELFVRAAIQGQTLFTAAGDGGAYDINRDLQCSPESTPACSLTLTVDNPASDTAITAAGGTTLAGSQAFCLNAACTPPFFVVNIPRERVWGWDYLEGLCSALGVPDPIACGIFPGGGGGGVSIIFEKPLYQFFLPGTQHTQPGQKWVLKGAIDGADPVMFHLPSNFPGRNVPDISANADPETGYVIYYTSDVDGFGILAFGGGTSFVAPQLAGVTALLNEDVHGRIGLLNFPLYGLALTGRAYKNPGAPLHAITDGDNWFYSGRNGYSPAAGLGTLDVANFAHILRDLF